jgi:hypothetical protein
MQMNYRIAVAAVVFGSGAFFLAAAEDVLPQKEQLEGSTTASTEPAVEPRVGWEESFDDISRWSKALLNPLEGFTPMDEVKAVDGCLWFRTPVGALNPKMKRPDWPEWPEQPGSPHTNWNVEYDDVVDIDQYPYLVMRIPEKATFFYVAICGKALKVPYTTGIHSQDLRTLGLSGKQRIRFRCQTLNTYGSVKLDYIRLVRKLTEEERKGFIDEGLSIREEDLSPLPYHGLEALNARAGRPNRTGAENSSEWVVYRDSGTGAEIWKMTDLPADEHKAAFNCDGSAFTIHGRGGDGFHVYDWTTGRFTLIEGGLSDAEPRFSPVDPSVMLIAENQWLPRTKDNERPREITIYDLNFRSGRRSKVASFRPSGWIVQEWHNSPDSSKMVFGLRESPHVFLIDPEVADVEKRVQYIKLPTRLKSVALQDDDTRISWHNCYTYQRLAMDLKTGDVTQVNQPFSGGHSAHGPNRIVGPYSQLMKITSRGNRDPQTEATEDDVKIFANYKTPVPTDYGRVSRDGKWVITNGVRGDVAGQHLLIRAKDPAAVLRLCFHNTSRNNWSTNTYSWPSPDVTKVAWVSDQFDDGDIYIGITGRPKPPTGLRARRVGQDVELTWKAPDNTREIAGYRIYRSEHSGRGFVALNAKPITDTEFVVQNQRQGFYLVAVVEPSGLEGAFSNEARPAPAAEGTDAPRTHFIEAEETAWAAPMRLVLDGSGSGARCLRYHKASPTEPESGSLVFTDPLDGEGVVWIRCRGKGQESWRWQKLPLLTRTKGKVEITVSEDSYAIDQIAVTDDPAFDPSEFAGGGPQVTPPSAVRGAAVADTTPQSIRLKWDASPEKNIARYDVHVGDDPDSIGNATIIGSTKDAQLLDWGLRPGTSYSYFIVAVNTRGQQSPPAKVQARTAAQTIQTIQVNPTGGGEMVKGAPKVTYTFEVSQAAPMMAWVRYSPAYVPTSQHRVAVELDGKAVGSWQLRSPYRPISWTLANRGKARARTFVDKLEFGSQDTFALAPGRHTITITCPEASADEQHAFGELIMTNDHSFRPDGYDPRANAKK